jgi:ubiquinone/menaquinone biosynthesis C-methylase UbiE
VKKQRESEERFWERYGLPVAEAMLVVEREAIGANVGANGYTTVAQADELGKRLGLGPGVALLDVGSGRGWPALYLAKTTGCRVVMSDLPLTALRLAEAGVQRQGLAESVAVARASATDLPFTSNVFDAVSHTDTL